jgi:hypothetical protein
MSTRSTLASPFEGQAVLRADGALALLTPDGAPVRLDDFAGATLVVQLVRYFGCLPCQVYLRSLDRRADALAAVGARAIAIGGSADYQARWLRDSGITMPLLLDPPGLFREWAGLGNLGRRQMLAPRGIRSYLSAVASGVRPRRPTVDVMRSPGIVILDADLALGWVHEGTALGDYPSLEVVIALAASVGGLG